MPTPRATPQAAVAQRRTVAPSAAGCSLEAANAPADLVEVARVAGAWGVQGWIKLVPHSADPQALFSSKRWYLTPPTPVGADQAPELGASVALLKVREAREHGASIVARADDITDRDHAQGLKGWRVWVSRASFPTPEANEYYWVDLIGLAVRNRQGVCLGHVTDLLPTGPQTTLVVRRPSPADGTPTAAQADVLIPFVSVYIDGVDMTERRIDVDWQADD
jgi:16S rRNA processing protein RimM